MAACHTCRDEGVIANDDDGTPWSFWAELKPPSNLAVVAGLVKPIPCPDQCARGIVATALMLQTGSPLPGGER